MQIIRKTQSVCPKCIKKIKADLVEEDGKVYMLKKCKGHGRFKVLISTNSVQYKELNKLYFSLDLKNKKQNYYNLYLTLKCNLNCPICYTNANIIKYNEPSIENIQSTLRKIKNAKIGLWGGEPTLRDDLPILVNYIKKQNPLIKVTVLTNAMRLCYEWYSKKLDKVDYFNISVHGSNSKPNDALTRTPGSFDKTISGATVIQELGYTFGFYFVITKTNYKEIVEFAEFVKKNFPKCKAITFSFPYLSGNMLKHLFLLPKLSKISPLLDESKKLCEDAGIGWELSSCGLMPLCTLSVPIRAKVIKNNESYNEESIQTTSQEGNKD